VPVGVPLPSVTAVRVAIKVTFEPVEAGLAEELTVKAEFAAVMVSVKVLVAASGPSLATKTIE